MCALVHFVCSSRGKRLVRFLARGRGVCRKGIVTVRRCDITWGYVAWTGIGEGWGRSLLFFMVGGAVSGSKNVSTL
jgi:hypothetical protein